MPGNRCSVASCKNNFYKNGCLGGEKKVSFFRFPKDPRLRKIWVDACKRNGDWNPSNRAICSDHFEEDDFERNMLVEMNFARFKRTLKPGRFPTVNLMPSGNVSRGPTPRAKRQKKRESKAIVRELLEKDEEERDTVEDEVEEYSFEEKYNDLLRNHAKMIEDYQNLKIRCQNLEKALQKEVTTKETMVDIRVKEILSNLFSKGEIGLMLEGKKIKPGIQNLLEMHFT